MEMLFVRFDPFCVTLVQGSGLNTDAKDVGSCTCE